MAWHPERSRTAPLCVETMRCLCCAHARGAPITAPCNANEKSFKVGDSVTWMKSAETRVQAWLVLKVLAGYRYRIGNPDGHEHNVPEWQLEKNMA